MFSQPETAKGYQNYARLNYLIETYAPTVLRARFKRRYARLQGEQWEEGLPKNKDFLCYVTQGVNWQKTQKEMIREGKLDKMDLSCLATLFRNIKWTRCKNEAQYQQDIGEIGQELKCIHALGLVRNDLVHLGNRTIPDETYNEMWQVSQQNLIQLGKDFEELNVRKDVERIYLDATIQGLEFSEAPVSEPHMTEAMSERNKANYLAFQRFEVDRANMHYDNAINIPGLSHHQKGYIGGMMGIALLKTAMDQVDEASRVEMLDFAKTIINTIIQSPAKFTHEHPTTRFYQLANDIYAVTAYLYRQIDPIPKCNSLFELVWMFYDCARFVISQIHEHDDEFRERQIVNFADRYEFTEDQMKTTLEFIQPLTTSVYLNVGSDELVSDLFCSFYTILHRRGFPDQEPGFLENLALSYIEAAQQDDEAIGSGDQAAGSSNSQHTPNVSQTPSGSRQRGPPDMPSIVLNVGKGLDYICHSIISFTKSLDQGVIAVTKQMAERLKSAEKQIQDDEDLD